MTGIPPVDPVEYIGQLRGRDPDHTISRRWPDEAPAPQCLRIDAAADADTVFAGKINLDRLRDGRWSP
jgi:hypothetical protein